MVMSKRALVVRELQRLKDTQGISQQALADRIGLTQPAVSDWLSGKSLPDAESLGKIESAFPELHRVVLSAILEPLQDAAEVAS